MIKVTRKYDYWRDLYGEQSNEFWKGVKEGIKCYAYFRDGVQYVGTTGRTLEKALDEIDEIIKEQEK